MPTKTSTQKNTRVGLLVTVALGLLMVALFFIGSEQKIFARKNEYDVRLENVTGLAQGNPVKMSGVTIGVIREIKLPVDPKQKSVEIIVMIDRKFSERVRGDSRVRMKKLGLLTGDAYLDVSPGTLRFPELEPGSVIPSQRQTDVESIISSGEDLVDNLVQISYSLKNILQRVDRGEGLLGEITSAPETKQRLTDTFLTTLNKTNAALAHIESGKGVVGKLIYDDKYGEQLTASIGSAAQSMQTVAANVQRGFESNEGVLPALLNDPEGKRRVYEIVENLRVTSTSLSSFMDSVQTGQGLLPRLLNDKAYGDQALAEFALLAKQLNETVAKINNGEGTAGKLISDPSLYESVNDILIGINESKLLRWLIRNRQQAGIERRYDEAQKAPAITPLPHAETLPRAQDPVAIPVTDTVGILPPPKTDTTTTEPPPPPNQ
jgi:phospholipid/cholesterol/gamma-HCH transport system substrate-binding protein